MSSLHKPSGISELGKNVSIEERNLLINYLGNIVQMKISDIIESRDKKGIFNNQLSIFGIEKGVIFGGDDSLTIVHFLQSISDNISKYFSTFSVDAIEYQQKSWIIDGNKNRAINNSKSGDLQEGICFYDNVQENGDIGYIKIFIDKDEYVYMSFKRGDEKNNINNKTKAEIIGCYNTFSRFENEIRLICDNIKNKYSHSLTGLYNKKFGKELLDNGEHNYSFIFFDIADFKHINDTFGHIAGDNVLIQFSSLMKKIMRPNDYLTCLGGDEFGILVDNGNHNKEDIKKHLESIIKRINEELEKSDILSIATHGQSSELSGFILSIAGNYAISTPKVSKTLAELQSEADDGLEKGEDGKRHRAEETVMKQLSSDSLMKYCDTVLNKSEVFFPSYLSSFTKRDNLEQLVEEYENNEDFLFQYGYNKGQSELIIKLTRTFLANTKK